MTDLIHSVLCHCLLKGCPPWKRAAALPRPRPWSPEIESAPFDFFSSRHFSAVCAWLITSGSCSQLPRRSWLAGPCQAGEGTLAVEFPDSPPLTALSSASQSSLAGLRRINQHLRNSITNRKHHRPPCHVPPRRRKSRPSRRRPAASAHPKAAFVDSRLSTQNSRHWKQAPSRQDQGVFNSWDWQRDPLLPDFSGISLPQHGQARLQMILHPLLLARLDLHALQMLVKLLQGSG